MSDNKFLRSRRIISSSNQGGILMLVMVLMLVFITVASYTLSFTNRQSHEVTNRKQEEATFAIAESGISFVAWLLDSDGGNYEPEDIGSLSSIEEHPIEDEEGNTTGTFTITEISADNSNREIEFTSFGKTGPSADHCQSIKASLYQQKEGEPYKIIKWDHQLNSQCP